MGYDSDAKGEEESAVYAPLRGIRGSARLLRVEDPRLPPDNRAQDSAPLWTLLGRARGARLGNGMPLSPKGPSKLPTIDVISKIDLRPVGSLENGRKLVYGSAKAPDHSVIKIPIFLRRRITYISETRYIFPTLMQKIGYLSLTRSAQIGDGEIAHVGDPHRTRYYGMPLIIFARRSLPFSRDLSQVSEPNIPRDTQQY